MTGLDVGGNSKLFSSSGMKRLCLNRLVLRRQRYSSTPASASSPTIAATSTMMPMITPARWPVFCVWPLAPANPAQSVRACQGGTYLQLIRLLSLFATSATAERLRAATAWQMRAPA